MSRLCSHNQCLATIGPESDVEALWALSSPTHRPQGCYDYISALQDTGIEAEL